MICRTSCLSSTLDTCNIYIFTTLLVAQCDILCQANTHTNTSCPTRCVCVTQRNMLLCKETHNQVCVHASCRSSFPTLQPIACAYASSALCFMRHQSVQLRSYIYTSSAILYPAQAGTGSFCREDSEGRYGKVNFLSGGQ